MSFLSKFKLDDEEMNVLECRFTLDQQADQSGKPASDPMGGEIRLVVESTKSTLLFYWMTSPTQVKDGAITFFRRDGMSKMKELHFKKGYCVHYDEYFIADSAVPMRIEIVISAKEIILNGASFGKNWSIG